MRAAWAALAVLPLAVCANFVTSLHSNFVVNLDFEPLGGAKGDAEDREIEGGKEKVMAFAGGARKFRCKLPGRNRTAGGRLKPDEAKAKAHFASAKLAWLRGTCWKMRRDYWAYDVCFGRKIVQYRADADMRFSLGEHKTEFDQLRPNGSIVEVYTGGADNRTSEIHYLCGSSESASRVFKVEEDRPLYYTWTVSSPAFCTWQKNGTETRDEDGKSMLVSSLLEELRGSCINVTQGWWTYEYCYPLSLTQFHVQQNGKKQEGEHILGTIEGNKLAIMPNRVNMSIVKLKPSISARERRAPPSNHRTLRQFLGGGTNCDKTGRPRQTHMFFQCPVNWQQRPDTRIVSIKESSLCEYEIMVHTTLVCAHEKFLPTLPRGRETIQCSSEP